MEHGLGRKVNHDPRSRNFRAPVSATHRPVSHQRFGLTLDQGLLGSCTGNALAHALNTRTLHEIGTKLKTQRDAVRFYSKATSIDPFDGSYPPEDTGSDAVSVCKVARDEGLIDGFLWAFGLDQFLGALQLNPVMFGTWWHASMFRTDANGFLWPDGRKAGGHEVVALKDNPRKEYVEFQNSWGSHWGLRGRFRLTYATLNDLLLDQGDAVVPTRNRGV